MHDNRRSSFYVLWGLFCLSLLFLHCGEGPDAESDSDLTSLDPAVINLSAGHDSINKEGSTQISATVYDESGVPIPDIDIVFTLNDPSLAYIDQTAQTDHDGSATVTLTARTLSGTIEITASAESITTDQPKSIVILEDTTPGQINLTIDPASILVLGTAAVTAEVMDATGMPVQNGTTVFFELANSAYGTLTETALTNNGFASATFTASNQPGETTIQVSSGPVTQSGILEILPAETASIQFISAEPQTLALKNSGGIDNATIQFLITDSNGQPQSGISVQFEMSGPGGGETIDSSGDSSPDQIAVSSNNEGIAQVILQSGTVAGPVTIRATIDSETGSLIVESTVVSIGGGTPSAKRFSVAAGQLNLPGLAFNGMTTDITAYLADRFGNYNVLAGTSVSFICEQGLAVDTSSVSLIEDGTASVTLRTQGGQPEDVQPETWETQLVDYVYQTYGYLSEGHPRDGLCSVLVYTKGEEHFDDSDANGIYESEIDGFGVDYDTIDDPFCDYNDNTRYDGTDAADPEEIWLDTDDDGKWDEQNGVWDSNKYIFSNFKLLVTGSPLVGFNPTTFNVSNGGSVMIQVLVCDANLNRLSTGTSISLSINNGALSGQTNYLTPNSSLVGPNEDGHLNLIEHVVIVYDDDPDDTDPTQSATLTVTVTWEGGIYTSVISGTID